MNCPVLWTAFLQPSLALPSGPTNKVAVVAQMEFMCEWDNMDSHSSRLAWLSLLLSAQCWLANNRDHCWSSDMAPFPRVSSQQSLVAGWVHWTTLFMERQHFVLAGMTTDSGYGFLSLACDASANTTIHGLSAFSTIMVFHTALLLTKEPTSQPGKCDRAMESLQL